jgi:signal transduction histidine kinase
LKNVRVTIDKNLPVLKSNRTILEHIFLNLIDNACKYLPAKKRGNKIQVSYSKNKDYSTFMVADNGIGISPEDQVFIFDPYKRAADDTDNSGSKGLGLTLVENMVSKLGGDISFKSEEEKGTTFYIRFKNINTN